MKIAVWHNLPSGGGKRALYYHVRGLVQRGHKVSCWSLDTADHSYLPLSEFAEEHIVPFHFETKSLKNSETLSGFQQLVEEMQAFDEASQVCAGQIMDGGFDILFANSALPFHVPFIMRHVQIPRVLYLQEPCRPLYEASPILSWVDGMGEDFTKADLFNPFQFITEYPKMQALRLQAKQEWLNVRDCDQVLVNSYFSRESFRRAYGIDSKVCYLGIDTTLFQDLSLDREPIVVGLGAFDMIKGVNLALKAMALVSQPRPRLIWIANSVNQSYKEEMIQMADSLGVDLTVKVGISNSELVNLLNTASLMVYTSRLEPFGFAPLEANACGLPVVAVAEGGVRETVKDGFNGYLVDPEPAAIAGSINKLLEDPALMRKMGKQAAEHVGELWNIEGCVDRLENVLLNTVLSDSKEVNNKHTMQSNEKIVNLPAAEKALQKAACTIIAKNYLAYSRTLAQSFLAVHPDYKFYVLIIDEFKDHINPDKENFEIIKLPELEIPNQQSFCFKYNIIELCTAAKPYFMEYLIREKKISKLLYLDPDILVTAPLESLYEKLEHHDMVLTPHLDTDYPNDGLQPDSGYILRAGVFNLGFIGLNSSENALAFLTWWKSKLYNDCVVDVSRGYFVDQKFIDLVPVFFRNIFIEKDTGYNIAYWNLHSREISNDNGTWLCNEKPMYFFHFSGYVLGGSEISSYLPNDQLRNSFSNRSDLRPLFTEYEKLITANGHKKSRKWNYTFATFNTGELIASKLRIKYRHDPSCWQMYGNPFSSKRLIAEAENLLMPPRASHRNTLLTAEEQLNAILNSRAWRLVSYYSSIKNNILNPIYNTLSSLLNKKVKPNQRDS